MGEKHHTLLLKRPAEKYKIISPKKSLLFLRVFKAKNVSIGI